MNGFVIRESGSGVKVLEKYEGHEKIVAVPDRVVVIEALAFFECAEVEQIILPPSVRWIGEKAFAHCPALKEINIPAKVTGTGNYILSTCTSLEKVTLDSKNISFGEGCFMHLQGELHMYFAGTEREFSPIVRAYHSSGIGTTGDYQHSSSSHFSVYTVSRHRNLFFSPEVSPYTCTVHFSDGSSQTYKSSIFSIS